MTWLIFAAAYLFVGLFFLGLNHSDQNDDVGRWAILLFWPFVCAIALGVWVRSLK